MSDAEAEKMVIEAAMRDLALRLPELRPSSERASALTEIVKRIAVSGLDRREREQLVSRAELLKWGG